MKLFRDLVCTALLALMFGAFCAAVSVAEKQPRKPECFQLINGESKRLERAEDGDSAVPGMATLRVLSGRLLC